MIYETSMIEHDGLRYQVQVRQCLDGSIQQRHVWYRTQAGEHDPPWVNRWIASCTRKLESAVRNMVAAPHVRDEVAEAMAALVEIAAGHNDARQRAMDALAAIRNHAA